VALAVEEDILFDPVKVCLLSPEAVVLEADDRADLFEQPGHT
jgi:hypothetical protein